MQHLARGGALRVPARVLIVLGGFLAFPGTAAAHSGAPTVALDFRLRISQATRALRAFRPTIVDGDRGLRLEVDPRATLVVLGDLQEPMIRFDSRGVWVNRHSPTAAGAKLIHASAGNGVSWSLASRDHGLRWHDHRLAPPIDLPMNTSRPLIVSAVALSVAALSACGGSGSSQPAAPTIQPARTFDLTGFEPSGQVTPGKPTTVAFTIRQPDGRPLVHFRRGAGPHTGVHMIIVRDDLATIVHRHPPIAPTGRIQEQVVFPAPGPYRMVADVYPQLSGPLRNFQLFRTIHVAGTERRQPLPPFRPTDVVDGYRVTMHGRPVLKAIEANFLTVTVTDPNGKPARFTPWYGALAHAIFFRQGSLDYFHTHVCAPGASGCTSLLGGTSVAGTSSTPGKLRVGVLVPVAGTWRLFLQTKVNGRILTAPFTLRVR